MSVPYISDCERGCRKRKNEQKEWDVASCPGCCKLASTDWLSDIYVPSSKLDIFEIRFKNTHKGFYHNVNNLTLVVGDVVAVEAASGHDIGIVSLHGSTVWRQMARLRIKTDNYEFKKIYRKVKPYDVEKWQEAIAREHQTMIKSRQIAANLNLNMKIGDVEFQGDGSKAIFYYIADERVDFRELIKRLAEEFHIRIEMKQIGARQEAGLIGGIGVCGRELCCSQWQSNFATVNTAAARWQDLSTNPQKLTGQCSKLKCCLNYEVSVYVDAQKDFPKVHAPLEAADGQWLLMKTDILAGIMSFTDNLAHAEKVVNLPVEKVKEIIALNKKGTVVPALSKQNSGLKADVPHDFKSAVGEDSITRFDRKKKSRKNRNKNRSNQSGQSETSQQGSNAPKNANQPPVAANNAAVVANAAPANASDANKQYGKHHNRHRRWKKKAGGGKQT